MKVQKDGYQFIWPTGEPVVVKNFLNAGVDLLKEKIGALSQDPTNPLSRVCVANSCFSLEPVRGSSGVCILRCRERLSESVTERR